VIVIYFVEKKRETFFFLAAVLYSTLLVLFKTDFLVEFDPVLLFPEGKRRFEQD
jgi:hypothetical protein